MLHQPPRSTLFPYTTLFRSGVTTNPSLMAKENITGKEAIIKHYRDICQIVNGPVSAEVIATDYKGIIQEGDRKSTRLNSSHVRISYAVFCLKKKKNKCTSTK